MLVGLCKMRAQVRLEAVQLGEPGQAVRACPPAIAAIVILAVSRDHLRHT